MVNGNYLVKIFLMSFYFCLSAFANYEVAICTVFQNEALYLKEWIEFHKLQDVQHFYLYNNNSQDDYLTVLAPYVQNNEVTLIEWPYAYQEGEHKNWLRIQCAANMDCIERFGKHVTWLAAIDVDEFLFVPSGEKLSTFLQNYSEFGGLCVNWKKFGTSHLEEIPADQLLIEALIHCIHPHDRDNRFIKSIVQPKAVKANPSAHYFTYKKEYEVVDANKNRVNSSSNFSTHILLDKIRIHHYWSRTEKYLREYKIPSRQKRRNYQSLQKLLEHVERCNDCVDTTIHQFVPQLRQAMSLN